MLKSLTIAVFLTTLFLAGSNPGFAQNIILPNGEYMDTASLKNEHCPPQLAYYYSVGGKYPESSATLLKKVQASLQQSKNAYNSSGYITFRFVINCEGTRVPQTEVLQTDEKYAAFHFDQKLVAELFGFLQTLDKWRVAKSTNGNSYSYKAFLTFKIKNGKVINIIP